MPNWKSANNNNTSSFILFVVNYHVFSNLFVSGVGCVSGDSRSTSCLNLAIVVSLQTYNISVNEIFGLARG